MNVGLCEECNEMFIHTDCHNFEIPFKENVCPGCKKLYYQCGICKCWTNKDNDCFYNRYKICERCYNRQIQRDRARQDVIFLVQQTNCLSLDALMMYRKHNNNALLALKELKQFN